jgi:hypothetical protein
MNAHDLCLQLGDTGLGNDHGDLPVGSGHKGVTTHGSVRLDLLDGIPAMLQENAAVLHSSTAHCSSLGMVQDRVDHQ